VARLLRNPSVGPCARPAARPPRDDHLGDVDRGSGPVRACRENSSGLRRGVAVGTPLACPRPAASCAPSCGSTLVTDTFVDREAHMAGRKALSGVVLRRPSNTPRRGTHLLRADVAVSDAASGCIAPRPVGGVSGYLQRDHQPPARLLYPRQPSPRSTTQFWQR
jgi:hypothetical protein